MKNPYIIDVNEYKKIFEEPLDSNIKNRDDVVLEFAQKSFSYDLIIYNDLIFRNRNQLFIIINRFLDKKIEIHGFCREYRTFCESFSETKKKCRSELRELKNLQLLTICKCELKFELISNEFQTLNELISNKALKEEDGGIFPEKEKEEFYESVQKLFKEVQKSEDLSS